ncbi:Fc receptor-like protein 5 [Paralichthys olivaceus]|uniref:Fc receptor-like protein 5 n=1 Tax=Paralichthys olivaceus TaxID=8255 RepID=UPI0037510C05
MLSRPPEDMKAVSLLLGVSVLLLSGLTVTAVSLSVSPNLQQFFSKDSVSLSCVEEGQTGGQTQGQTGGHKVKRTARGQTGGCGQDFWTMDGSSCSISDLSSSDSGVYWCETSDGQKSQQVNISVQDDQVILQIPALPVCTGSDVTLCCRNRSWDCEAAYFFRDESHLLSEKKVEWIFRDVRQTDEGNYRCSIDLYHSPHSWLRVAAPPPPPSPPPPPPPHPSVFRLFCLLVVVCLFCICSVIMMSMCCSRMTGNKSAVSMEMTPCVEEYDYITDDVITHHDV